MISRRRFLRGAGGVLVALPFLPSLARAATQPKRFVAFCHPNGVYGSKWYPTGSGNSFALNETHAALESLRSHLLWVSGLNMIVAKDGEGEQHQRGLGALLTGSKLQAGPFVGNDGTTAGWASGPSIDQALIAYLGTGSKAASLQLGVHAAERDVSGALSYAGAAQPLLPQNDPLTVFRALFSDIATPPGELAIIRHRRSSVLDAVIAQITSLQSQLSAAERVQLDQHLTHVRTLETRIATMTSQPAMTATCTQATEPQFMAPLDLANMAALSKLQLDLLVLALTCDLVRTATIAYSDVKNHVALPFLGINSDVHNLSHLASSSPERIGLFTRDKWQAEQFGYFVQRCLDTQMGDGTTLLDHTLAFWGSELSVGNTHSHDNMPFLFAGHGAGWTMGRALTYAGDAHNKLLVSIMQSFGSTNDTFGVPDYSGPLTGLV